ncbi:MAG: peptide transporter ATP-binding protein [Bacteroidetes bacterium]|nr:peptide transporter ATP-binding protein [Bacteroidota bacterium]
MNTVNPTGYLLDVQHLSVSVTSGPTNTQLIHDVNFSVGRNETLILLGESGSGKTILSRSLTKLFPVTSALKIEGDVTFENRSLLTLEPNELALVRRNGIRYVFQEPIQSLNPVATIRIQMGFATNGKTKNDDTFRQALASVGLDNSKEILDSYPHQLSIGMAQRVCIAMAILPSPKLLIADEPTSAVDASLRFALLDLLLSIQQNQDMSLILITHDLDVARSYGNRIIVMYGGRIIESADRNAFFEKPLHPYSRLLLESMPTVGKPATLPGAELQSESIDTFDQTGCRFQARCPIVEKKCKELEPDLELASEGRMVRCFYWK